MKASMKPTFREKEKYCLILKKRGNDDCMLKLKLSPRKNIEKQIGNRSKKRSRKPTRRNLRK
jgi:hypothetical protein